MGGAAPSQSDKQPPNPNPNEGINDSCENQATVELHGKWLSAKK